MMPQKEGYMVDPEDDGGCFHTGKIYHINKGDGMYLRKLSRILDVQTEETRQIATVLTFFIVYSGAKYDRGFVRLLTPFLQ